MGIEISTEIGSTSDLALKVARGELDFLIASLAEDSPIEGIETTLVGTMPLALLARHDHPVLAEGLPGAEALDRFPRSEEHTSELQSLMRISYAVFCLKKKNTKHNHNNHTIYILTNPSIVVR